MGLREDITEALVEAGAPDAGTLTDAVWNVLQDKVGAIQEQLMLQLSMTRTELEASRQREAALLVTVQGYEQEAMSAKAEVAGDAGG